MILRDPAGRDGAEPRVLLRPGRCFPAVYFPASRFPLRDSYKKRFLSGQDACPMAPTGVPPGPSSVKRSSWYLVRGKTLIQGDILSQVLPTSAYPTPIRFKSLE